jgi:SAM-dependent methyltransferase
MTTVGVWYGRRLDSVSLVFAATLFATSALLFVLEPLVGKVLLPTLGGGAPVWTTTAAFFQLALLVGYVYAHVGPSLLGTRRHAGLHVALLSLAALLVARGTDAPLVTTAGAPAHPAWWLFASLARSVGLPFVLLAASTPLLQRWFAAAADGRARDPYFLFAASNLGSLVALLAYPVLLEPLLGLTGQRRLWSSALIATVALVGGCAVLAVRRGAPGRHDGGAARASAAPSVLLRARWLVLSAVPSSLLLSVTSYVSADIAALPLLWVWPLALYLVTFIVAFGARSWISPARVLWLQPFALIPIAVELFLKTTGSAWPLIPLHGLAFFLTALACHQALAASRPAADRSTEFYLWVAAGGALGGLANVFVAPVVFTNVLEYPLGLVAATLLRPRAADYADTPRERRLDLLLPAGLGAALLFATLAARGMPIGVQSGGRAGLITLVVLLSLAGAGAYAFRSRSLRFGAALAVIAAVGSLYAKGGERVVYRARSFYGVHTVVEHPPSSRTTLMHGSTVHGAQDLAPARRREPLSYYARTGPIGAVMTAWQGRPQRRRVGVVGLGAGALAAYGAPGERWTFFEIDPVVVDIARDRGFFTYLADARAEVDFVIGDARRTLDEMADGTLGLLVLDAFSADAIPAHLLTREALAMYVRKLAAGGVIAFHLSNRHVDLEPVVAAAAAALGLSSLTSADGASDAEREAGKSSSLWMVVARTKADLAPLAGDPRWVSSRATGDSWTDDKSDLWSNLHLRASEVFDFGQR